MSPITNSSHFPAPLVPFDSSFCSVDCCVPEVHRTPGISCCIIWGYLNGLTDFQRGSKLHIGDKTHKLFSNNNKPHAFLHHNAASSSSVHRFQALIINTSLLCVYYTSCLTAYIQNIQQEQLCIIYVHKKLYSRGPAYTAVSQKIENKWQNECTYRPESWLAPKSYFPSKALVLTLTWSLFSFFCFKYFSLVSGTCKSTWNILPSFMGEKNLKICLSHGKTLCQRFSFSMYSTAPYVGAGREPKNICHSL